MSEDEYPEGFLRKAGIFLIAFDLLSEASTEWKEWFSGRPWTPGYARLVVQEEGTLNMDGQEWVLQDFDRLMEALGLEDRPDEWADWEDVLEYLKKRDGWVD